MSNRNLLEGNRCPTCRQYVEPLEEPEPPKDGQKKPKFPCGNKGCYKKFTRRADVKRHMDFHCPIHRDAKDEQLFFCHLNGQDGCEALSFRKDKLTDHLRQAHRLGRIQGNPEETLQTLGPGQIAFRVSSTQDYGLNQSPVNDIGGAGNQSHSESWGRGAQALEQGMDSTPYIEDPTSPQPRYATNYEQGNGYPPSSNMPESTDFDMSRDIENQYRTRAPNTNNSMATSFEMDTSGQHSHAPQAHPQHLSSGGSNTSLDSAYYWGNSATNMPQYANPSSALYGNSGEPMVRQDGYQAYQDQREDHAVDRGGSHGRAQRNVDPKSHKRSGRR